MTIPQGYKQTELGIIPEDWEVVNLGNIAKVNGRIGFRGYTVADLVPKGFGAITLSPLNIINNQIDYSNCTYISWYKYHESPEIKVRNGDILLVKTGSTFGKSAFVKDLPEKATINPQFVLLNNFKCDSRYLSYVIANDIIQNQIHADIVGGAIPTLSQEKIANFTLFAPIDIAEQRAIAEALSDVDGLIAALDKKIAKKRLIKQGLMQELLTGKKRLPGFSDEWGEKKLGDIGSLLNGYAFKSERYNQAGKYKVITIANVQNGRLDINNCNKVSTIPSDIQKHQILKEGNILISMTGNVGRACLVTTIDCLLNQRVGLFIIQNNSQYNESFIYTIINSKEFETAMIDSGQGAAQSNIGKKDIEEYTFLLPNDIKEQQAIATILSDMDKEIADLEVKRDKYRLIKSGMMQKLLTGQIRLKIE